MDTTLYREIIDFKVPTAHWGEQAGVVSRFSPQEIRETISRLVSEERVDLAAALAEAGLAIYPRSEDVLAIAGLLAMLREEWEAAVGILNELLSVQGERAPITSHLMFIRALRCSLEPAAALSAVMIAHEHYPNHEELAREFESISGLLGLSATAGVKD
jgi:hypothetical protein